jgi:hypothetical protein
MNTRTNFILFISIFIQSLSSLAQVSPEGFPSPIQPGDDEVLNTIFKANGKVSVKTTAKYDLHYDFHGKLIFKRYHDLTSKANQLCYESYYPNGKISNRWTYVVDSVYNKYFFIECFDEKGNFEGSLYNLIWFMKDVKKGLKYEVKDAQKRVIMNSYLTEGDTYLQVDTLFQNGKPQFVKSFRKIKYGNSQYTYYIDVTVTDLSNPKKIITFSYQKNINEIQKDNSNNLFGVKNIKENNWLVPPVYNFINFNENFCGYVVAKDGVANLLDINGKPIFDIQIKDFYSYKQKKLGSNDILNIKSLSEIPQSSPLYFLKKIKEQEVSYDLFKFEAFFTASESILLSKNYEFNIIDTSGKRGVVDGYGKIIVPFEYDNVQKLNDSSYLVKKDNAWGIVGNQRNIKIPLKYSSAIYTNVNDLLIVDENRNGVSFQSLIDCKGREIIKPIKNLNIWMPNTNFNSDDLNKENSIFIISEKPQSNSSKEDTLHQRFGLFSLEKGWLIDTNTVGTLIVKYNRPCERNFIYFFKGKNKKDLKIYDNNGNDFIASFTDYNLYFKTYPKSSSIDFNRLDDSEPIKLAGSNIFNKVNGQFSTEKMNKILLLEKNKKVYAYNLDSKSWLTNFNFDDIKQINLRSSDNMGEISFMFLLAKSQEKWQLIDDKLKLSDIKPFNVWGLSNKSDSHFNYSNKDLDIFWVIRDNKISFYSASSYPNEILFDEIVNSSYNFLILSDSNQEEYFIGPNSKILTTPKQKIIEIKDRVLYYQDLNTNELKSIEIK